MMKKILLLLFLLPVFALAQKTTPGNYTYVAQKYEWDAGIFKGLGLPAGPGPAAFIPGQVPRAGALYYDSSGVDEGLYKWTGLSWQLVGSGGGSTETASEGLTKVVDDIQLGQTIGAVGDPAIISVNREIPFSGTSYFRFKSAANEVRFNPAGAVQTYNPLGGGYHAMVNPTTATRAFPGLAIWRNTEAATAGATLLAHIGVDINQVGGAYHHLFIDVRNELDFFKIEFNGSSSSQWQNNGDAMIGGFGTKRTRFGSYVTPTRTVDITGSYSVSDSALFPNRLSITDSTGFDVAMLDRSTGLMKRIRVDQLGVGGGGGSQTLQQVFDTQSGKALLTSNDTISTASRLVLNSTLADYALKINNTTGAGLTVSGATYGIFSTSGTSEALGGYATGSRAADIRTTRTSNNTIESIMGIYRQNNTFVGADGIGGSLDFFTNHSTGVSESSSIISKYTNATAATRIAQVDITLDSIGVETTAMNIQNSGIVRVNNNADTLATKAYARSVGGVGGSGDVVGPASATDGVPALFDGTTGKLIKNSTPTGTGNPVMQTSPTLTTPTVSGTISSSAVSVTITNASGEGNALTEMTALVNSDVTLANSAADQTLFGTTNDVWTLQGNTTYKVKGMYRLTSGSTVHTWAMGFTLGGGATISSILYGAGSWVTAVNATSTARTNTYIDQVASTVCTANSTTASFIEFEGIIVMDAGGTVTPIIKASVDPTGTILLKANSYISFIPIGNGTFEKIGNVN